MGEDRRRTFAISLMAHPVGQSGRSQKPPLNHVGAGRMNSIKDQRLADPLEASQIASHHVEAIITNIQENSGGEHYTDFRLKNTNNNRGEWRGGFGA